jgi:D-serine deaminase-like pyridoxal phosphate-dependent protein
MADRLAELFANKPLSYTGAGLSYAGDASGHAVTLPEQGLQVKRNVNDAAATASSTHPFKCPKATDGSTASVVVAGDVNGVTATNLSLTISNSGTKVVYVDVTYTADVTANNYVVGFSGAITCALATGSSVPSDTSTHLYRHIATYVNGARTVQAVTTSLEVVVRDDGSGTSTATAIWGIV